MKDKELYQEYKKQVQESLEEENKKQME